MDYHVYIINQHPLKIAITLVPVGIFSAVFFNAVFHMLCNRPHLRLASCFANDKKIGNRFIDFTKIKGYNMFSLFSWIAARMVLMIFEFLVNRTALFFLRLVKTANCSKY